MIKHNKKGFTLIEILLVLAILAILAGIVIVAISPAQQLRSAANDQRRADINTIMNAIYQYSIDNGGALPPAIAALPAGFDVELCKSDRICNTNEPLVDATGPLADAKYLNFGATVALNVLVPRYVASLPIDPTANGCSYTDIIPPAVGSDDPDTTCYTVQRVVVAGQPDRVRVSARAFVNTDTGALATTSINR